MHIDYIYICSYTVCIYIYIQSIYVYIYICICICKWISLSFSTSISIPIYLYLHLYISLSLSIYMYMYIACLKSSWRNIPRGKFQTAPGARLPLGWSLHCRNWRLGAARILRAGAARGWEGPRGPVHEERMVVVGFEPEFGSWTTTF